MSDNSDDPSIENTPEPANLRFLRVLVTVLTATMILGVLTIIALLVIRLQAPEATATGPVLPSEIVLPEGVTAQAVTAGSGWFAIVTQDNRILIYSDSGALLQDIPVTLP